MQTLTYRLTFHTPAFLGNAEQAGQWRTPPIKALLRQWWRVAYAADCRKGVEVDVDVMRRAEGLLFGHAWLENDRDERGNKVAARRSEVRLRLSSWERGTLTSWDRLEQPKVHHPEAEKANYQVGPHAYLGFGPLDGRGGTKFADKVNAAIKNGELAVLSLAVPTAEATRLQRALALMNLYGTLGGRSRNGWGSFSLTPLEGSPALDMTLASSLMLPWRDALDGDWPQAIGRDGAKPLIWQTDPFDDWKKVMVQLAKTKIALRTQFKFTTGKDATSVEERHWLSYPVTNHSVKAWGGNARLPNSLRFKVRPDANGKLRGVIFHVPCKPPAAFRSKKDTLIDVWEKVHQHLEKPESGLKPIPA